MGTHPLSGHPDVLEVVVPVATMWTRPDAPRDVDRDAVADLPDMAAWADRLDTPLRQGLKGRTLTQLLLGEAVLIVEDRGDWVRVVALGQPSSADMSGYPGWMRRAHLGTAVRRTTGPAAFVMTRSAACDVDDGTHLELSFGTGLWVESTSADAVTVLFPGDRRGQICLRDVRLAHKRQQPAYGGDDVLAAASQFLGLRYLWGGTSTWGLDCSGLVHLVYRAFGVLLPRDAADQAAAVEPVALHQVRQGDLYFFAPAGGPVDHVGLVSRQPGPDGVPWMLHAPEAGMLVEECPMPANRRKALLGAGRVRKPTP